MQEKAFAEAGLKNHHCEAAPGRAAECGTMHHGMTTSESSMGNQRPALKEAWKMNFKALRGLPLALLMVTSAILLAPHAAHASDTHEENPVRVVALGDSLTAGYGLPSSEAFPAQLEVALQARGYNVVVENAGVSGDTATQGLARLDWSVPDGTQAVIVALGANDMLRGLPTEVTRTALTNIVIRLKGRGLPVLVSGMRAAPNMGESYRTRFDAIYPELRDRQGVLLQPFFLEGVAGNPGLNQKDGLHPTGKGVARMVEGILPYVELLLAEVQKKAELESLHPAP